MEQKTSTPLKRRRANGDEGTPSKRTPGRPHPTPGGGEDHVESTEEAMQEQLMATQRAFSNLSNSLDTCTQQWSRYESLSHMLIATRPKLALLDQLAAERQTILKALSKELKASLNEVTYVEGVMVFVYNFVLRVH